MKLTTLNVVSPVASMSLLIGSDVHHSVDWLYGACRDCKPYVHTGKGTRLCVVTFQDVITRARKRAG